jgi:hypothetical protein
MVTRQRSIKEECIMKIDRLVARVRELRFWVMGLGAFAIGIILIFAGEVMHTQLIESVQWLAHLVRDLGISFLVAGIVGIGVDRYTREDFEEALRQILAPDGIKSLGIKGIYTDRLKLDFLGYIKATEPGCEIRLLGISMNRLANLEAQAVLKEKINNNCKIKLLLLDPTAEEELERRAIAEKIGNVAHFRQEAVRWNQIHEDFVQSLVAGVRDRIEIRHYRTSPDYFLIDNDRVMLLGFYLHSYRGEDVPHIEMEIKKGGAYGPFRDHFDGLWNWVGEAAGAKAEPADRRQQQVPVAVDRRHEERRRLAQAFSPDRRKPAA